MSLVAIRPVPIDLRSVNVLECCKGINRHVGPHVDPYTPEYWTAGRAHSMKRVVFWHSSAGQSCTLSCFWKRRNIASGFHTTKQFTFQTDMTYLGLWIGHHPNCSFGDVFSCSVLRASKDSILLFLTSTIARASDCCFQCRGHRLTRVKNWTRTNTLSVGCAWANVIRPLLTFLCSIWQTGNPGTSNSRISREYYRTCVKRANVERFIAEQFLIF